MPNETERRNGPLFQLPPEDLSGIDDAQLAELAAGLRERVREVYDGRREPSIVGDRTQSEVSERMQEAVLAIETIDAELAARAEQDGNYDVTMDDLASRAGVRAESDEPQDKNDDDEEQDNDDEESGEGRPATTTKTERRTERTEKTEETAAVADDGNGSRSRETALATIGSRPLPAARRHRPVSLEDDTAGLRVTSHAAGLGAPYSAMTQLDRRMVGEFYTDIIRRNRVQPGQKAVLAHASYTFPSERILVDGPDSHLANSMRIRDVVNPTAIVASGGLCAPLPAVYDLPGVESAARPVRNALPSFQAARGGVQLGATPVLGDYEDAIGVVTAAENEAGGTNAVKSCMRIECPQFQSVTVDSIYQCIEADNLAARAYPELMARINDLVMAEQARLADSRLLSAIKAGSTNVTFGSATPGAIVWFMGAVYTAASGIRSRHRMPEGTPMQALLPAWIIDLLALDAVRGPYDRFQTRSQIETVLRQGGITPTFYLDGPDSGTGQIWGAQNPGALLEFPDEVQWAVFPTGTWLHLDAGELQLGVVRDSTLNSTNDFQIFSETWEQIGKVGVESLWVTTTVCPSGAASAPTTAPTC